jgi:hypothetical protein
VLFLKNKKEKEMRPKRNFNSECWHQIGYRSNTMQRNTGGCDWFPNFHRNLSRDNQAWLWLMIVSSSIRCFQHSPLIWFCLFFRNVFFLLFEIPSSPSFSTHLARNEEDQQRNVRKRFMFRPW